MANRPLLISIKQILCEYYIGWPSLCGKPSIPPDSARVGRSEVRHARRRPRTHRREDRTGSPTDLTARSRPYGPGSPRFRGSLPFSEEKINGIVQGIRETVDSALDWLLDKAERALQSALSAIEIGGEEDGDASEEERDILGDSHTVTLRGEEHQLYVDVNGPTLVLASTPTPVTTHLERAVPGDPGGSVGEVVASVRSRAETIESTARELTAHEQDVRTHEHAEQRFKQQLIKGVETFQKLEDLRQGEEAVTISTTRGPTTTDARVPPRGTP